MKLSALILLAATAMAVAKMSVSTALWPVAPAANPLMPLQPALMVVDTNAYPVLPRRTNYTLVWSNRCSCPVVVEQSDVFPPKWFRLGTTTSNSFPVLATNKQGFWRVGAI